MSTPITGLHHVTALAGPPQRNVDFHVGTLGLRLVKRTVNFDAPDVYHLYYGDRVGTPGSILTIFPFPMAAAGKFGVGESIATAFAVPTGAIDAWMDRFADLAVDFDVPTERFGQRVLAFRDADGMPFELIETVGLTAESNEDERVWTDGPVDAESAIRRFHGVTLLVDRPAETARILTDVLGYEERGTEDRRTRFTVAGEGAVHIDLLIPDQITTRGRSGHGTTHHIAFRTPDDETQATVREQLMSLGLGVTTVQDRNYFRSIYFREPSGVLFEVATDPPGFLIDEDLSALGTALKLPPQYESRRAHLEASLPALTNPVVAA
ncbi:MAG: ring-cleaving dioxygenase [Bacteroidota bacterium]